MALDSDNPYASPKAEPGGVGFDGLTTDGVRFSGRIARAHIRRARDLRRFGASNRSPWGRIWETARGMSWMDLGMLAFTPYAIYELATRGARSMGMYLVCLGVVSVTRLYYHWKAIPFEGAAEAGGLRLKRSEQQIVPFGWSCYEGYRLEQHPVPFLLLCLSSWRWQAFPRELFATDADWETFLAVVRDSVPPMPQDPSPPGPWDVAAEPQLDDLRTGR